MKSELNLLELKNDITNMQMNDDQILHRAASILRRDIQSVQLSSDVYPSPPELALESSNTNSTPCLLTRFLLDRRRVSSR